MALFCAGIRRDSVFLSTFPFFSHVHDFTSEMLLISRIKRLNSCVLFHFSFLVIFVLLVLVLSVLFLVAVISLSPRFSMSSSSRCIDASTLSSMLVSPLSPFFLDTYSLSTSSLECYALYMVISFLVLWYICLISSLVHFKNGLKYLMR